MKADSISKDLRIRVLLNPAPVDLVTNSNHSVPSTAYGVTITVTDSSAPAGTVFYRVQAEDDFIPQSPLAGIFQVQAMFSAWVSTQAGAMTTTVIEAPAINYGQNGLVTVSVTSAGGAVIGNVTLTVDAGAPITVALTGGVAVFDSTIRPSIAHTCRRNQRPRGQFRRAKRICGEHRYRHTRSQPSGTGRHRQQRDDCLRDASSHNHTQLQWVCGHG